MTKRATLGASTALAVVPHRIPPILVVALVLFWSGSSSNLLPLEPPSPRRDLQAPFSPTFPVFQSALQCNAPIPIYLTIYLSIFLGLAISLSSTFLSLLVASSFPFSSSISLPFSCALSPSTYLSI